jgi:hypothetical protein
MSEWIACGEVFIEADVIRWKEAVWKPKARRNSRAVKIGDRTMTAQVLKLTPDGWALLVVKKCETTNAETWWRTIPALKAGAELRRRPATLSRGRVERLPWSDESARAAVVSRFLKPS